MREVPQSIRREVLKSPARTLCRSLPIRHFDAKGIPIDPKSPGVYDVSFVQALFDVLFPHLSIIDIARLQMIDSALKLNIEHILTPQEYPMNPHMLEFEDDSWKDWLNSEKAVYVNWWFKGELPETSRFYLGLLINILIFSGILRV